MKPSRFLLTLPLLFSLNGKAVTIEKICNTIGSNISKESLNFDSSANSYKDADYYLFIQYNSPRLKDGQSSFDRSIYTIADNVGQVEFFAKKVDTVTFLNRIKEKLIDMPKVGYGLEFGNNSALKTTTNKLLTPFACYSVQSFTDCRKALNYLIEKANPRTLSGTGAEIIFGNLLNDILTEKKYGSILKELSISLIDSSIDYIQTGKIPTDDIYSRTYSIAVASGLKPAQAQSITMQILGAYAIRGSAYFDHQFVRELRYSSNGISLLILSTTISYFDKITFKNSKQLFSLPRKYMSTTCHYGKPYHFWMAAYMSNLLKTEGKFTARKSFLASHLSGVGYEMVNKSGGFNGRDKYFENVINAESVSDINVRSAKLDVVFNSLGAGFGVSLNAKKKLNADVVLKKSFDSGFIPWVNALDYQAWMNIVDPHAHIDLIVKP